MTSTYIDFEKELRNSHSDSIKLNSEKMRAWLSDVGDTTFDLSSGTNIIPNIPNMVAGGFVADYAETIEKNSAVSINDSGLLEKIKGFGIVRTNTTSTLPNVTYYSTVRDRIVTFTAESAGIYATIGSVEPDGTITYGTPVEINTDTNTKTDLKILELEDDKCAIYWLTGTSSAVQWSMQIVQMNSTTSVIFGSVFTYNFLEDRDNQNVVASTDLDGRICVATFDFGNRILHSSYIRSSILEFSALTLSLVASSGNVILDSTSIDVIKNSMAIVHDTTNDFFVLFYSTCDPALSTARYKQMQTSVSPVDGAVSSLNQLFSDGDKYRAVLYATYTDSKITLIMTEYDSDYVHCVMTLEKGTCTSGGVFSFDSSTAMFLCTDDMTGSDYKILPNEYCFYKSDEDAIYLNYKYSSGGMFPTSKINLIKINNISGEERVISNDPISTGFLLNNNITHSSSNIFLGGYGSISTAQYDDRESFIGFTLTDGVAGDTGIVVVRNNQIAGLSSLEIGAYYYFQKDGSVSTTETVNPVGVAISTTDLKLFS